MAGIAAVLMVCVVVGALLGLRLCRFLGLQA
jgi:hypothetical protein